MKHYKRIIFIIATILCILGINYFFKGHTMTHALCNIRTGTDAIALFPKTVAEINKRTDQALEQAKQDLEKILAIPTTKRTFSNTAQELDHLNALSDAVVNAATLSTVDMVHPDEAMRNAARQAVIKTQNFFIDNVSTNRTLYNAFKDYVDGNAKNESLSTEQKEYLDKTMDDFEHMGLNLPEAQLEKVKQIKKNLVELEQEFDKNIAQDQSSITVAKEDLQGLSDDFIESLSRSDDGKYILGIDYPTYLQVMDNCSNSKTRHALWKTYMNRAYPANKAVLEKIIAARSELAQLLGFDTYASFELDGEMVETPERAQQFLDQIYAKVKQKTSQEFKEFTKQLPPSVTLTNNKLQPWDVLFLKNSYKKTAFDLDENKIAHYFPMQNTIDSLLKIYQDFLSLEFKQLPVHNVWHPDVKLIEIFDKNKNEIAGYLFMDLHPRPNKYNHACEHTLVPVTYDDEGKPNRGAAIVIANFPKPTTDKPSLLLFKDVTTFFHEFGHAMHALLGRTDIASFAGTSVKRDFVELPSQMLEEWMWDPEILKMVSSHYQTGKSLPDELIATILKSRVYDSGFFITRQLYLANLSLQYFNNGPSVNLDTVLEKLFKQFMHGIQFSTDDHFYAAFGHLTGYGARYYGYMWSKVFAHDLFNTIKKEGLLNPVIGQKYINTVIGKGGSKDPNDLLQDFLGRKPNQEAFLHDMGL